MEAAISACCKVLRKARESHAEHMELEVRLQNVPEPFFNRVATFMDAQAGKWDCTDDFLASAACARRGTVLPGKLRICAKRDWLIRI